MDISQVYMVRSAKGNDMLCVDSFLYYYDDRGVKSYRWSCSKRKDKVAPCKSRIITNLIDDDDETKHTVIKVFSEHSHGQCSAEEISKAFERKRIANLEGKPCTLEAKAEKRKLTRQEDEDVNNDEQLSSSPPAVKKATKEAAISVTINKEQKQNDEVATRKQKQNDEVASNKQVDTNVYLFKTTHGREMVCVDGYLYRLEGTGLTNRTYRWECSRRRDDGCKARLQTLRMRNGRHTVKERHFNHTHPPYPSDKLASLFGKQPAPPSSENIKSKTEDFEEINLENSSKMLRKIINADADEASNKMVDILNTKAVAAADVDDKNQMPKQENDNDNNTELNSTNNVDPLEANNDEAPIATGLDLSKISFLPSSKGNNMLCVDNYLYHFDSRSSNKQRVYWTCIHRRDKIYNCKARITSDDQLNSNIKFMKVSGRHMHPNDIGKINERLYNDLVVKAANSSNVKPKEFLNSTISELNDDVKDIVVNAKDTIRRKIARLRYKIKQKDLNMVVQRRLKKLKKEDGDEDEDSMSSLSSSFHSDDDDFPALPMNLDEMKRKSIDDSIDNDSCDDITFMAAAESSPNKPNSSQMQLKEEQQEIAKFEYPSCEGDQISYEDYPNEDLSPNKDADSLVADMDLTKISTLRSAKGGELLCIDDFLYHVKSARDERTYWECIKSKDKIHLCKSRVTTITTASGYIVKKVTNLHSHAVSRAEVEKRIKRNSLKEQKLNESGKAAAALALKDEVEANVTTQRTAITKLIKMRKGSADTRSVMKLYSVSDGPPSLAVQMTLKALKIPYELVNIDFCAGEHMTEEYAKMNPQKEIPVLDDDGFYLSESIAIMQYLCDKYAPMSSLYPKDATQRAVVNQRLCFNMGFYYASISVHAMAPIFFDYPRSEMSLKRVNNALSVFEKYLEGSGSKYAAGEHLTIADFPLVTATLCLEAIGFDLSGYPLVKQWYDNFKQENPELWQIGNAGMKEIENFEQNPPDLTNLNHPFHPARKITK